VKAIAERHQSSEIIHALKLLAREGAAARRAGVYDNYVVYVFLGKIPVFYYSGIVIGIQ
jgi:hypothetical protein